MLLQPVPISRRWGQKVLLYSRIEPVSRTRLFSSALQGLVPAHAQRRAHCVPRPGVHGRPQLEICQAYPRRQQAPCCPVQARCRPDGPPHPARELYIHGQFLYVSVSWLLFTAHLRLRFLFANTFVGFSLKGAPSGTCFHKRRTLHCITWQPLLDLLACVVV